MDDPHVTVLLDRAAEDLVRRFGDTFSLETIREVVQESWPGASPVTGCSPSPRTEERS